MAAPGKLQVHEMEVLAKPGQRIPELDGIRGVAIALVLVWHYLTVPLFRSPSPVLHFIGCATIQTWSGVDLFFVLSGFLIGGILIDAKGSEHYFRTFYIRRAFRILPIYTVACLAYFPVARLTAYAFHSAGMKAAMPWYIYATFTQNFWLANGRWYVWLSPTWSLAIEEQFYLTLPLLIWMLPARNLRKTLIAGVAAIFVFRYAMFLHYPKWSPAAFYVLAPFRSDGLLMGVIAAIAVRDPVQLAAVRARRQWLILAGAVLAAFLTFATWEGWGAMSPWMSTVGYSVLGAFYVVLLLLTVTSSGALKRIFSWSSLRWLGTIAYGLYLVHVPALDFSDHLFRHRESTIARIMPIAIALAVSLLVAHSSWMLFESRLVRYGHRFAYGSNWEIQKQPRATSLDLRAGAESAGASPTK